MRGGLNTHLGVSELNSLLRPGVGQANVEFDEVEVQRLEAVELAVELGLAGGGDHHGVVDALAVDGFAGGEETRTDRSAGVVGFAVLEGAVGVVGDGAQFGDAVDEPETAHAVAVVDGVVGVGVGVVLPQTGHDGGVAGFDGAGHAGGWSGAVRRDAGDAVVRDEDVDVCLFVGAGALPEARGMDEEFLFGFAVVKVRSTGTGGDGFRGAVDELQFAVIEIEDFGGVALPGGGVGGLVIELDGGAGGMAIGVDWHGVEEVIHDEGHLFAVGRVDGAVLGACGDGLERSGREELGLAGGNVDGEDGAGAFAEALGVRLDGGDGYGLAVGEKAGGQERRLAARAA